MKKIIIGLVVIITILFLNLHQAPVMSTGEAIVKAIDLLNNSPEEWGKSVSNVDLKEIPPEDINTSLNQKEGLWNRLTNKKQWEVTIKFSGTEPTVIMDANSGEFIDIYGPLN